MKAIRFLVAILAHASICVRTGLSLCGRIIIKGRERERNFSYSREASIKSSASSRLQNLECRTEDSSFLIDRKSESLRRYLPKISRPNCQYYEEWSIVYVSIYRLSDCRSDDFSFCKICIWQRGGSKRRRLKSTALYIILGAPIRSTNLRDYSINAEYTTSFRTTYNLEC